jgi:DHHC palmitoyltransferase
MAAPRPRSRLVAACQDLRRALFAPPNESFAPFNLLLNILYAGLEDAASFLPCATSSKYRSWTPALALLLITTTYAAYVSSLRYTIRDQTCNGSVYCIHANDVIVSYLVFMMLYYYIKTCYQSPGVAVSDPSARVDIGGIARWPLRLDARVEHDRYCTLLQTTTTRDYHPSPTTSICNKCEITRPPRAHHCSVCQQCILQFDHHCVWLNQCIGLYNYRSFLMTVFYILTSCIYGLVLLWQPFYGPLQDRIRKEGWKWRYDHGTGFLDLPAPSELLKMMYSGSLPPQVVLDCVFPLLFAVGCILSAFLGMHTKYCIMAYTTLEYRMYIDQCTDESWLLLAKPRARAALKVNPYDWGWRENLRLVFGDEVWRLFVPFVKQSPINLPRLSVSVRKEE